MVGQPTPAFLDRWLAPSDSESDGSHLVLASWIFLPSLKGDSVYSDSIVNKVKESGLLESLVWLSRCNE
jgi:hypothetical protein